MNTQKGFSLVETIIGLGVMALAISAGLIALGQTTLLSEKNSRQIMADFVLRSEVEALRAAPWSTVNSRHTTIQSYQGSHSSDGYPSLMTLDKQSLQAMRLTAAVNSARLNTAGETGKLAFRVLVSWQDRSEKTHQEARVLVITEGGLSAD
jgi:prepilin-type N-terminal cleavage/methylation domain-containing protein